MLLIHHILLYILVWWKILFQKRHQGDFVWPNTLYHLFAFCLVWRNHVLSIHPNDPNAGFVPVNCTLSILIFKEDSKTTIAVRDWTDLILRTLVVNSETSERSLWYWLPLSRSVAINQSKWHSSFLVLSWIKFHFPRILLFQNPFPPMCKQLSN